MFKYLAIMLTLLMVSMNSNAAKECHLGTGDSGTTLISLTGNVNALTFAQVADDITTTTHTLRTFNADLTPALYAYCGNLGQQGEALFANTYSGSKSGSIDNKALFPTNVDGIYYTVEMFASGYEGRGFFPSASGWQEIFPDRNNERWDENYFKASITLYQITNFSGNVNRASYLTPKDSRTLGQLRLGEYDTKNNNPWEITVTPSSFRIPITAATCQTAMVNSGTNNVDFGDVMLSSLRDRNWPKKGFDIKFGACSNVVWTRFKLSSTKSTTNNIGGTLLTNTLTGSTAANGVAILLDANFITRNGKGEFTPGSEIWSPMGSVSASQSNTLSFTATMQPDGNPITVGDFKAIGTFTIDYF